MVQAGIEINELVQEVLSKPCFGFVVGLDEVGHPEISRCFGFNFDTEQAELVLGYARKNGQR